MKKRGLYSYYKGCFGKFKEGDEKEGFTTISTLNIFFFNIKVLRHLKFGATSNIDDRLHLICSACKTLTSFWIKFSADPCGLNVV